MRERPKTTAPEAHQLNIKPTVGRVVSENSADHDESACAKTVSAALSPQAGPKNAAPMTPCFAEHVIPRIGSSQSAG